MFPDFERKAGEKIENMTGVIERIETIGAGSFPYVRVTKKRSIDPDGPSFGQMR